MKQADIQEGHIYFGTSRTLRLVVRVSSRRVEYRTVGQDMHLYRNGGSEGWSEPAAFARWGRGEVALQIVPPAPRANHEKGPNADA